MDDTFTFNGMVRKDFFGNIVVDTCSSDEEHLRSSETDPTTGKPSCRKSVNQIFDQLIGRSGHLMLYVEFEDCDRDCTEEL